MALIYCRVGSRWSKKTLRIVSTNSSEEAALSTALALALTRCAARKSTHMVVM